MPRRSGSTKVRGPLTSQPVHQHPAGGRRLDPGGDAQQRGLAAARMAEQADDLARLDGQRDAVERAPAAIGLDDVLEGELGRDRGARRAALAPAGQAKPVAGGAGGACGHSSPASVRCMSRGWKSSSVERILVLAQGIGVGGHRHREVGGHAAFEEARALQLLEARQVLDGIEAEMLEEAGVVP